MHRDKPYWAGLCDIPNGIEFYTAEELVQAQIYDGKSLQERWDSVRVVCLGGIPVPDYIEMMKDEK